AKGCSQAELAAHLGLSTGYISDIERSRRGALEDSSLEKAAEFLDVSKEDLHVEAALTREYVHVPVTRHTNRRLIVLLLRLRGAEVVDAAIIKAMKILRLTGQA